MSFSSLQREGSSLFLLVALFRGPVFVSEVRKTELAHLDRRAKNLFVYFSCYEKRDNFLPPNLRQRADEWMGLILEFSPAI